MLPEAHVFCADRTMTRDFGDKKKREEKKERFLEVGQYPKPVFSFSDKKTTISFGSCFVHHNSFAPIRLRFSRESESERV